MKQIISPENTFVPLVLNERIVWITDLYWTENHIYEILRTSYVFNRSLLLNAHDNDPFYDKMKINSWMSKMNKNLKMKIL